MKLLETLKTDLSQLFASGEKVCLWFSGGADSELLMTVMSEMRLPFRALFFDDGLAREQILTAEKIIAAREVMTFSYPPRFLYLIAKGDDLSVVANYAVDASGNCASILRDVIDDDKGCAFDFFFKTADTASAPIEFDIHILGTRQEDTHWSLEKLLKNREWKTGEKRFIAPLADWKRRDVIRALKKYGVAYETPTDALDTGNVNVCARCLRGTGDVFCPKEQKTIPPFQWNREENLKIFRASCGE